MSEKEEKETPKNYVNRKFFKFTVEVVIAASEYPEAKAKAHEIFGADLYEKSGTWERVNKTSRYQFDTDERKDIIDA